MRTVSHLRRGATRLLAVPAVVALVGLGAAPAGADALPIDPVLDPVTDPAPTLPSPLEQPGASTARQTGGEPLIGTFELTAASCTAAVTGSYFRMIQPGGDASGPFVQNGDSSCGDNTYTPMAPGTDGGLVTGEYQAGPDPAFDTTGGGRAARITEPQKFFGVDFASATNPTDPQTGTDVPAPSITHDGAGGLSGDLRAFAASWNNQHFNQGAPKPDGSTPGATAAPTGTFEPTTGAFVIEWTSQIVGGPFNGFTGLWHFEGTFESSQSTPASTPGTSSSGDTASPAAGAPSAAPSAAQAQSSVGGSGTSAASTSGSGSISSGASAADPLAFTGPTFPAGPGLVLLAGGLAVYALRRRLSHEGAVR